MHTYRIIRVVSLGVSQAKLSGTIQNDILKEYMVCHTHTYTHLGHNNNLSRHAYLKLVSHNTAYSFSTETLLPGAQYIHLSSRAFDEDHTRHIRIHIATHAQVQQHFNQWVSYAG